MVLAETVPRTATRPHIEKKQWLENLYSRDNVESVPLIPMEYLEIWERIILHVEVFIGVNKSSHVMGFNRELDILRNY